ncbi:MAG: hypothetical protein ACT4OK_14940 [Gemmobacter sp.]
MADGTSPTISPREAIALGMKYFTELMEDQPTSRVLLEGLALEERTGNWVVTVGFDSEREVPSRVSPLEAMTRALSSHYSATVEIVREFRAVKLSSLDGQFVKLEHP